MGLPGRENLARNAWKRQGREQRALRLLSSEPEPVHAGTDPSVRDAVERLPARLRKVVLLHYFADLPVTQVADALGIPTGTAKRRLHDARKALAESLGVDE